MEADDPVDHLLHKSIDKHQLIALKVESLLDSVQLPHAIPERNELVASLREMIQHTLASADLLHRARRGLHGAKIPEF